MKFDLVFFIIQLVTIQIAVILCITVWARTRDRAWLLIVIGVLSGYGYMLYSFFETLGFIPPSKNTLYTSVKYVLPTLHWIFLSFACIIMLTRSKK